MPPIAATTQWFSKSLNLSNTVEMDRGPWNDDDMINATSRAVLLPEIEFIRTDNKRTEDAWGEIVKTEWPGNFLCLHFI